METTQLNKENLFDEAYETFEPTADDSLDCIPFYRAFAGLRAAWGNEFCDQFHHAVHQAACWSSGTTEKSRYQICVDTLRHLVEQSAIPPEPRSVFSYDAAPTSPTEYDARQFFNGEYKKAFPEKRANSKHANGLWKQKKAQSVEILENHYTEMMRRYDVEQERIKRNNQTRRQEWINSIHKLALFENAAKSILAV